MKKILFLILSLVCVVAQGQTAYPYVQRNGLLTSGRVPFVTANGILVDSASLLFDNSAGSLSVITASSAGDPIKVQSTSASGYSEYTALNDSGTQMASFGWGNASATGQFASSAYISFDTAVPFKILTAGVAQANFAAAGSIAFTAIGTNQSISLTPSGSGSVVIPLITSLSSITGTTGNMTITAGTGNSRSLILQTTTSGGVATTALTLDATQGATVAGDLGVAGGDITFNGASTITGGAGNMTVTAGTGNSRTLTLQTTTSGGTATPALTLDATQSATVGGDVTISGGDLTLTGTSTVTGGAGNMTITSGTGASRTLAFRTTTSGSTATTALTLGADQSATIAGNGAVAGAAVSSSSGFVFPVGTTALSSFRIPHGAAPTSPVNGDFWTTSAGGLFGRINGATINYGAAGAGTVSVVGAGSLTSTALVTGGGTTTIQTPSATATMDSSGNISTPGTLTVGNAATTAGAIALTQGTTQSAGTTNITIQAPAAVTSYVRTLPGAVGSTGVVIETVSGSVQTESVVTTLPSALTIPAPVFSTGATASGSGNFDLSGSSGTFKTQTGAVTLGTTSVALPTGTAPTTSAAGVIAFDTNAWATSFGAIQVFDGTANTYVVAALASDTPTNGQVPTWNTGGTVTWETPSGGGSVANPTATIGLTAVNGVATSAIRSDGAPALSQAIAPTWTGVHNFAPTARSSGVVPAFLFTTPADTAQTASTESIGFSKTAATRQHATGTLTTQREVVFAAPTNSFVGASTLTTAINVDIADPVSGTNATVTNTYGLRVNNQQVTGTLTANTGTNLIGPLVDSVDGTTPLNNIIQTVASGTAYTLTATSAAVDFGTTDPIVTLPNAGTYWVTCDVQFNYVGATFAANRTFDLKLRRTNNTAADVTGSAFSEFVPVLTTITNAGPHSHIGPFLYTTANTTDTIQIFADISTLPTAGTVTVTAASIVAMRAY